MRLARRSARARRRAKQLTRAFPGPAALAALRKARASGTPFALVLLDAMMPGVDGFDVAAEIHASPLIAGVTVMMLSSIDLGQQAARCEGRPECSRCFARMTSSRATAVWDATASGFVDGERPPPARRNLRLRSAVNRLPIVG